MTGEAIPTRAGSALVRGSGGAGFVPARIVRGALVSVKEAGHRSVCRRRDDPRPATVPAPQWRTGVLQRSRRVSGGAKTPRERERLAGGMILGCRGEMQGCREGELRAGKGGTPTGVSPPLPARYQRSPGALTSAVRARYQRAPARRISFGRLGECLGRQVCVPFLSIKGVSSWLLSRCSRAVHLSIDLA